ncbi:MAG: ATP-dependent Clp protease adapter ClpS [Luteolibacter sp.]
MPEAMGDSDTLTLTRQSTELDVPWNVIVHDDPVNLMGYVTMVLMKIFGYDEKRASKLMLEVHRAGRSVVWSGQRERAEMHTQQLQAHQLKASIEKSA